MAEITLKQVPDEIYRAIKRLQLDLEDENIKISLEDIYSDLLERGLEHYEKEKAAKK
ncbi:hypothetical protein ACVWYN_002673 [Pedobacter sp. UYP24]